MLIKIQPFKKKFRNILKIISEIAFLLAIILLTCYATFEASLGIATIKIVGWVVTILFVINLCLELISQLMSLKKKKKDSKTKKVHPENKNKKGKSKKEKPSI
jgi:hypothetical protein